MHDYASDSWDRCYVPWICAVVAVALTYGFTVGATALHVSIPWWFEAPSVMSLYGILSWLYTHHLWRWSLKGLRFSGIPDLNGAWFGEGTSTLNGSTPFEGMLTIHQTWSGMVVEYRTDSSTSYSRMACLSATPGPMSGLLYEYANAPHSTAEEGLHSHRGTAHLELSAGGKGLEGDYYTGRDRSNQGRLKLRKVGPAPMEMAKAKAAYEKATKKS